MDSLQTLLELELRFRKVSKAFDELGLDGTQLSVDLSESICSLIGNYQDSDEFYEAYSDALDKTANKIDFKKNNIQELAKEFLHDLKIICSRPSDRRKD